MDKDILFRQIIAENKDRIYRISCCYVRDADERNDIFQEVLIHIWEHLDAFRNDSHINTWIYRIAVNTCLNHLRSEKRRRQKIDADGISGIENIPDPSPPGGDEATEHDIQNLYSCIARLRPIEKTLISLYLEDASMKEISDVLGISEVNVRVRIHRTKEALKEMMKGMSNGY